MLKETNTVKDIMTITVLTVSPDMSLIRAAQMLNQESFAGLPVVDNQNRLLGLLTTNHLAKFYSPSITTDLPLHLPTLIVLLKKLRVYKKDKGLISEERRKILDLKVADVMSHSPVTLSPNSPISEAVNILKRRRVDPVLITDDKQILQGIVTRSDLIKLLEIKTQDVKIQHEDTAPYFSENVKKFMEVFEKEFTLVSRMRTYYWLLFSLVFALVGFAVAYIIILRVNLK